MVEQVMSQNIKVQINQCSWKSILEPPHTRTKVVKQIKQSNFAEKMRSPMLIPKPYKTNITNQIKFNYVSSICID